MAGHKMSGYVASLRQALFASFIQLFNRIFPFNSTAEKAPPKTAQQQPSNPSKASTAKNKNTDSPLLSSSSLYLHSSHELRHSSPQSFIDLEQGIQPSFSSYFSSLSSSQDEYTMAPNKKRGGRKRGGSKNNANGNGIGDGNSLPDAPSAPSNGPSNAISNQFTATQPTVPSPALQGSGPARATSPTNQGDTKANSYQPAGQHPSGAGIGDNDRQSSSQQSNYSRIENLATARNASFSQPQSSALEPLVIENQAHIQGSANRSHYANTARNPTPNRPGMAENIPPSRLPEGPDSEVNSHSIHSFPNAVQPPRPSQAITTLPAKTVVIPRPTVALPLTDKTAPKLAPALPASIHNHLPGLIEPKTEAERIEREHHLKFMRAALDMGNLALSTNETPVGCVIVYHGRVIARGMNATNNTRNGTRHAEFMAISALLSRKGPGDVEDVDGNPALDDACWGDIDPSDGHLYPYGQKLHPAPVVSRDILSECILYVTVEPCVMCASLLRQLGINKVYFGAVNDKFGGTGGVFKIHMNSKPVSKPADRPYQNGYGPQDVSRIAKGRVGLAPRDEDDGDGGNVERGYSVEGGYLRDDAVSLLRRFYVQENGRAPQPRKKEGRAARLYAMENQGKIDDNASDGSDAAADAEEDVEVQEDLFDGEENIEAAYSPTES
ncbi:cytidine deaminase-like protein [Annulohypoxylon maeteangense]|uniref:cytidine deaminase-like protein n=1 Tax=Annulohypoxylon maeteangense TaxID=1927788 RepID=UPI0020077597|nr:cytidine deaminase-like protein [Annulohypoxylon maeteangense]KAI0886064.1 cytidine deaminase-like protein [Annulohypoxylon maeteangense]